ncbi:carbonic anhydrase [Dysgonamonadaceae bacterium]|nr:carbonic anhydrase [Dysgonamonadaceae bacterium]
MWAHTKESQDKITPLKALEFLKEGNLRFINNLKTDRNLLKQVNLTSEGQFPFATILSCIDSRTSAELIFDQGLGDIFSIRIAGNILNEDILGSMEYACDIVKSKIIVVLGHTNCGAIISACNNLDIGHITNLLGKIKPAIESEVSILKERNGNNVDFVNSVCINNINWTIKQIREKSLILRNLENSGDILIVGGLYSVETGVVNFFD